MKANVLRQAVLAALSVQILSPGSDAIAAPKKGQKAVECFGINSCKGTNGCGVGNAQIEAANAKFSGKFAKSKRMECAGSSDCSAKSGFLAWVDKPTAKDCISAGGFIFEKDKAGEMTIKDKV